MKFVIATGNEGKVREFKRILEPMGFEVSSLKEMGSVPPDRPGGDCG